MENKIKAVFSDSLASANRGNPFISKADAMKAFAEFHKARRAGAFA